MISKITDHAESAKSLAIGYWQSKPRMLALIEALNDELQLAEDVLYDVLQNSPIGSATGLILDEWGDLFDEPRGSLSDADYQLVLGVVMAAHQSDGGAAEIEYLASQLLGVDVHYSVYPLAHYRLTYATGSAISGDWEARVLRILEIMRPAGVSYQLIEGSTAGAGVFRFDSGPGFDQGKLARRVI